MLPLAGISAGLGIAKQLFGSKKRASNRQAIAELRASQPTGYLTPADLRASELTRGRLNEGVNAQGRLAGYDINRRFAARGLAGSPSEERAMARLQQETALGTENAGNTAEEQLYNIRQGREAFQHQNDLAIFGTQTGANATELARQNAQQGAFWNSLNEFIPTIMGGLRTPGGSGTTQVAPAPYGPTASGSGAVGPAYGPPRGFQPEQRPSF